MASGLPEEEDQDDLLDLVSCPRSDDLDLGELASEGSEEAAEGPAAALALVRILRNSGPPLEVLGQPRVFFAKINDFDCSE